VSDEELCSAGRRVFLREPDGTWPTRENPCTERTVKNFTIVTPGVGRYQFVEGLCGWHEMEFLAHFQVTHDEFTPEGKRFRVEARREGAWWELTVHGHGVTQCQLLGHAWETVSDYLFALYGTRVGYDHIDVAVVGDPMAWGGVSSSDR
jgi:hypothetical protein